MDFYETLHTRRSVRAYTDDRVPEDVLHRVLDAARIAPSACNLQPWRFLVLTSPEKRALACSCYPRAPWLAQAPVIVVALGSREKAWKRLNGQSAHTIDVSIALEHLVLAAAAEGLGTCWICAFDQDRLAQAFALEPEWEAVAMTPLGYPAAGPNPFARKELGEIVRFL
jgi:nitroreductase